MRREIRLRVPVTGAAARLVVECEEGPAAGRQMGMGTILLTLEAGHGSAEAVLDRTEVPELCEVLEAAAELSDGELMGPVSVEADPTLAEVLAQAMQDVPLVADQADGAAADPVAEDVEVPIPEPTEPEPPKARSHHKR